MSFVGFLWLVGIVAGGGWGLALAARRPVNVELSGVDPDRVAEFIDGKFSAVAWGRESGPGDFNFRRRSMLITGATLSIDVMTDNAGNVLVAMWMSQWKSQVAWSRLYIPVKRTMLKHGLKGLEHAAAGPALSTVPGPAPAAIPGATSGYGQPAPVPAPSATSATLAPTAPAAPVPASPASGFTAPVAFSAPAAFSAPPASAVSPAGTVRPQPAPPQQAQTPQYAQAPHHQSSPRQPPQPGPRPTPPYGPPPRPAPSGRYVGPMNRPGPPPPPPPQAPQGPTPSGYPTGPGRPSQPARRVQNGAAYGVVRAPDGRTQPHYPTHH